MRISDWSSDVCSSDLKIMKVLYRTEATATGGRTGSAKTADGAFAVKLTAPKELGGPGGEGNNPEQLFASGYSACFLGAIQVAAGKQKVKVSEDRKSTRLNSSP